jgi:hypothetical protein
MKGGASMKLILALIGAALVAGCSSLQMKQAEVQPLQVCDTARMQRIEQRALESRVQVTWVHCPSLRREPKTVS